MIDSSCGKGSAAVIPAKPLTKTRKPEPDNSVPFTSQDRQAFKRQEGHATAIARSRL
jgi:hypothetical protein